MKITKVLIIRFSSIGDILLTTPVVRAIKDQTKAELHFITKLKYKGLLSSNPNIDRLHLINKDLNRELIEKLRSEKFDLIVDLHKNLRTLRLKRALKVPSVVFDKINFQKWLTVRTKNPKYLPSKHIVDRYFDGLESLGIQNPQTGLEYFFSSTDQELQKELKKVLQDDKSLDFPEDGGYLVMVLAAAHQTKAIPPELGKRILNKVKIPVVLVGGSDYTREAAKLCSESENVISLVGRTSFELSAYILKKASLVLTPDTGLMHLSAALGKKTISIWGNTIPEFGMYPYFPDKSQGDYYSIFEVDGLKCRPCSKLGYNKCPKRHFRCMNDQNVDAIVKQVELFHKNEPPSP